MNQKDLLAKINSTEKVIIELGCGTTKMENAIGIDALDLPGVDFVTNLENGLPFLPDNSVDEIHSSHFLEHIENFEVLLREIHRVLKPNGKKFIAVPHFSNPYYYSDYTHKRFFGLYTFDYFSLEKDQLKRKVPAFYVDYHFKTLRRKLIFNSPPFPVRHAFKKRILQNIFNLSSWWQELYEENFAYIFPCQEIQYLIQPIKEKSDA
ncbi:MAG: class I SAM-dependent methyltransferase [Candidatus Cyclobacteriaceae bacterium M2_1C_046]